MTPRQSKAPPLPLSRPRKKTGLRATTSPPFPLSRLRYRIHTL